MIMKKWVGNLAFYGLIATLGYTSFWGSTNTRATHLAEEGLRIFNSVPPACEDVQRYTADLKNEQEDQQSNGDESPLVRMLLQDSNRRCAVQTRDQMIKVAELGAKGAMLGEYALNPVGLYLNGKEREKSLKNIYLAFML